MRTISANLKTTQKAKTRTPFLQAIVNDRFAGIRRLRYVSVYSGSEADKGHSAAAWLDGGTRYLLRARFDGTTLYRSRVIDPTDASDFSIWTSWSTAFVADLVAFAKAGSTIWAFVVLAATPTQIHASKSTDNGATWSAFALQFTHTATVQTIAAAGKSDGDVVVLAGSAADNTISAYRWTGAAWNAAVNDSADIFIQGLAVIHAGDWNVIVTGTDSSGGAGDTRVRSRVFGDGFSVAANTWSSTKEDIAEATDTAGIDYKHPYIGQPDVYRVTFRQNYTGTVAYDRLYTTRTPATSAYIDYNWREPTPFDLTPPFGAAITTDNTNVYLTTAKRVFLATLNEDSLDFTADVIRADLHTIPFNPRLSHIDINNADGTYKTPGAGAVVALTKGADVTIAIGYHTPTGDEASLVGAHYHITGFEHVYEKGVAILRLILGSVWTHLARHRFPRAVNFADGDLNVFGQLEYVITRAGSFEFSSIGGSPESANLTPPLVIPPGTSALTAIMRILEHVPDTLFSRGEFIFLTQPLAADAADITYKRPLADGDQELHTALYGDHLKDANHVQIFADEDASIVADDPDFADIALLYSAARQRHDPHLDTGSEATDRATREQRQQTMFTTRNDHITAPVHAAIETNDIIAITDDRHGLTAAKRRVLALRLRYDRHRSPRYEDAIELGAP